VALGVPGRLRPRIFSTFGTTRVVGRQLNAPAAFTAGEIPGIHFQSLIRPQGTWKKSQVTPPGIDPGTVRLVAQRLNHYATPGPHFRYITCTWRNNIKPHLTITFTLGFEHLKFNKVLQDFRFLQRRCC
jgi:hypothetical protein